MTDSLEDRRKREREYYCDLYREHNYFAPTRRHVVTHQVIQLHGEREDFVRWLDVGCGGVVLNPPKNVKELVRNDYAFPGLQYQAAMHELIATFGLDSFDVVSSFDVLEHLLPEELDEGIQNLMGVCRGGGRLIISVGTKEGGRWAGRIAHRTIQPMEWWRERLKTVVGVEAKHVATAKKTSPFFVLDLP